MSTKESDNGLSSIDDDELISRYKKLRDEYKEIAEPLSDLLFRFSRARRELIVIGEEFDNRKIDVENI